MGWPLTDPEPGDGSAFDPDGHHFVPRPHWQDQDGRCWWCGYGSDDHPPGSYGYETDPEWVGRFPLEQSPGSAGKEKA